jgi:hypothetical protein
LPTRFHTLTPAFIYKVKRKLAKSMKSWVPLLKFTLPSNLMMVYPPSRSIQKMRFLSARTNYYHSNDLPIPAAVDNRVVDVVVEAVHHGVAVEEEADSVAAEEEGEMAAAALPVVVVVGDLVVAEEDRPAEPVAAGDSEADEAAVGEDFKLLPQCKRAILYSRSINTCFNSSLYNQPETILACGLLSIIR